MTAIKDSVVLVTAVVEQVRDVTVLVNNAGIARGTQFLTSPLDDIRREFEINFYGPLLLARALVPVIERNGGGHVLNVHSVLSWVAEGGACSASKAAFWSQTNSLRLALKPRGIGVTGLHMGYVDTDMAAHAEGPEAKPEGIAAAALDGVESDAYEVLADDITRWAKGALSGDLAAMYAQPRPVTGPATAPRPSL
ncbi:SDR family NAD(P)-dependent oxidoreductase [Streptomyces sp. NPDC004237]|uniref:SDR family NAD(P)-dependent oxidoreductase n=1 Tax=Streptomyces sp. NPDC004237 TaxID=3154455 RepID=UPI0033A93491